MKDFIRNLLLFIMVPLLIIVGFSSWIIVGEKNATVGESSTASAVAYYYEGATKKEYTRIEKALDDANAYFSSSNKAVTVYVYTKTNPTIKNDCVISSGVTLCIPYDNSENYYSRDFGTLSNFADNSASTYRQNRVVVDENVTIINNGTIQIGGIFGKKNQGMSGGPNGNYCELALSANAKIISSGNIYNYGFIKEADYANNGSMVEILEGNVYIPFIIYDLKTVSDMLDLYGYDTSNIPWSLLSGVSDDGECPFDIYDFVTVQSKFRVHYGSTVNGEMRMEVDDQNYYINLTIIGPTSSNTAIILESGYIDMKYKPQVDSSGNLTNITPLSDKNCYTEVDLYGDMTLGSLQFSFSYKSIVTLDIDTTQMFFPLSYKLHFNVKKGSRFNVNYDVKCMPGSKIEIDKGGTCNVSSNVSIYPSTFNEKGLYYNCSYPSDMGEASFINNGVLSISGLIGGYVKNVEDNAILCVYKTPAEVVCPDSTTITSSLSIDTSDGSAATATGYYSKSTKWYVSDTSFAMNYKKVVTDAQNQNPVYSDYTYSNLSTLKLNGSHTLVDQADTSTEYFVGWFYDQECSEKILNSVIYGSDLYGLADEENNVTIYAKWTKAAPINVTFYNSDQTTQYSSTVVFPGDRLNMITGPGNYDYDLDTTDDKKEIYKFYNWDIKDQSNEEVLYGLTSSGYYDIPNDFSGTELNIYPNFIVGGYKYKLTISGTYESVSSSSGTVTGTGTYWVLPGELVTISIKGDLGIFSKGDDRTCTIQYASFTDGTTTVTAAGDRGFDDRVAQEKSFYMPNNYVELSTT